MYGGFLGFFFFLHFVTGISFCCVEDECHRPIREGEVLILTAKFCNRKRIENPHTCTVNLLCTENLLVCSNSE